MFIDHVTWRHFRSFITGVVHHPLSGLENLAPMMSVSAKCDMWNKHTISSVVQEARQLGPTRWWISCCVYTIKSEGVKFSSCGSKTTQLCANLPAEGLTPRSQRLSEWTPSDSLHPAYVWRWEECLKIISEPIFFHIILIDRVVSVSDCWHGFDSRHLDRLGLGWDSSSRARTVE